MKHSSVISVLSTLIFSVIYFPSANFVVAVPIIEGKAADHSIREKSQINRKLTKKNNKKKKTKSTKSTKSSKSSKANGDFCAYKTQEDALLAFKAGITNDPNNTISNWVAGGSVCNGNTSNWSGITCVSDKVTKLELDTKYLSGTLSPLIGCLSDLTVLDLGVNDLSGSIPSSLGDLKALTTLELDDNDFSGQIPDTLGNLSNLMRLIMYSNNLNGILPVSLGNLSNLRILDVDDNNLSGTIPSSFGNLFMLEEFYFGGNNLVGSVPSEVCDLTELDTLWSDCTFDCICCDGCYSPTGVIVSLKNVTSHV